MLAHARSMGEEVFFVTSRPGLRAKLQTERWLLYTMDFACPTVIVSRQKGLVAAALGIDLIVDDKPENVREVMLAAGSIGALFDQPWNQGVVLPVGGRRVASVGDALTWARYAVGRKEQIA